VKLLELAKGGEGTKTKLAPAGECNYAHAYCTLTLHDSASEVGGEEHAKQMEVERKK